MRVCVYGSGVKREASLKVNMSNQSCFINEKTGRTFPPRCSEADASVVEASATRTFHARNVKQSLAEGRHQHVRTRRHKTQKILESNLCERAISSHSVL